MLNPLKIVSKLFKSGNQKEIDRISIIVNKVNELEQKISKLKDEEFPKKTEELKNKIKVIYHLIDSPKEKYYLNNTFNKNKVCFFSSYYKGLDNSYKLFFGIE